MERQGVAVGNTDVGRAGHGVSEIKVCLTEIFFKFEQCRIGQGMTFRNEGFQILAKSDQLVHISGKDDLFSGSHEETDSTQFHDAGKDDMPALKNSRRRSLSHTDFSPEEYIA